MLACVRFICVLSAAVALGLRTPNLAAAAHDQAIGYTEITLPSVQKQGRTGHSGCVFRLCPVQIIHRYTLHDAEAYAADTETPRRDLILDLEAQADFARYVAANFELRFGDDRLRLLLIGAEVEAGHVWVYQETLAPRGEAPITVSNTVLMESLPQQINRINLRQDRLVRTLVLNRASPQKTLSNMQVTGG